MTKAKDAVFHIRGKLDTLRGVRIEMARVYRAAWNKKIPITDMNRYIFALKEIRDTVAMLILERVDASFAQYRDNPHLLQRLISPVSVNFVVNEAPDPDDPSPRTIEGEVVEDSETVKSKAEFVQ